MRAGIELMRVHIRTASLLLAAMAGGCGGSSPGPSSPSGGTLLQGDSSQKPAYVHLHAFVAGAYTLGILNLGPGAESGTYEVTLTR